MAKQKPLTPQEIYKARKQREEQEKIALLPPGLYNHGNTCFMNSVLQALLSTQLLFDLVRFAPIPPAVQQHTLITLSSRRSPQLTNGHKLAGPYEQEWVDMMPIGDAFLQVLCQAWDLQMHRRRENLSPRAVLQALSRKYDQYLDFAQQDAHEFLRILLDAMRMEELDVIKKRQPPPTKKRRRNAVLKQDSAPISSAQIPNTPSSESPANATSLQDNQAASTSQIQGKDDPLISFADMIFGGQLTSILVCQKCKHISQTYEDFNDISLSIKPEDYYYDGGAGQERKRDRLKKFAKRFRAGAAAPPAGSSGLDMHRASSMPPIPRRPTEQDPGHEPSAAEEKKVDADPEQEAPVEGNDDQHGAEVNGDEADDTNITIEGSNTDEGAQQQDGDLVSKEDYGNVTVESDGSHVLVGNRPQTPEARPPPTSPEEKHVGFLDSPNKRSKEQEKKEKEKLKDDGWSRLGRRISLSVGLGKKDKKKDKSGRSKERKSADYVSSMQTRSLDSSIEKSKEKFKGDVSSKRETPSSVTSNADGEKKHEHHHNSLTNVFSSGSKHSSLPIPVPIDRPSPKSSVSGDSPIPPPLSPALSAPSAGTSPASTPKIDGPSISAPRFPTVITRSKSKSRPPLPPSAVPVGPKSSPEELEYLRRILADVATATTFSWTSNSGPSSTALSVASGAAASFASGLIGSNPFAIFKQGGGHHQSASDGQSHPQSSGQGQGGTTSGRSSPLLGGAPPIPTPGVSTEGGSSPSIPPAKPTALSTNGPSSTQVSAATSGSKGKGGNVLNRNIWFGMNRLSGIEECLRMFTAVEILDGDNMVGCRRCWKISSGVWQQEEEEKKLKRQRREEEKKRRAALRAEKVGQDGYEHSDEDSSDEDDESSDDSSSDEEVPVSPQRSTKRRLSHLIPTSHSSPTVSVVYAQLQDPDAHPPHLHQPPSPSALKMSPHPLSLNIGLNPNASVTSLPNEVEHGHRRHGAGVSPSISPSASAPSSPSMSPSPSPSPSPFPSPSLRPVSLPPMSETDGSVPSIPLTDSTNIDQPSDTVSLSTPGGFPIPSISTTAPESPGYSPGFPPGLGRTSSNRTRPDQTPPASAPPTQTRTDTSSVPSSSTPKKRPPKAPKPVLMRPAYKRYLISTPPPVLVIHLKRFQQISKAAQFMTFSHGFRKLDDYVTFPEYLDLGPFLAPKREDFGLGKARGQKDQDGKHKEEKAKSGKGKDKDKGREICMYRLYSVVVHIGNMLGGHYIAYTALPSSSPADTKSSIYLPDPAPAQATTTVSTTTTSEQTEGSHTSPSTTSPTTTLNGSTSNVSTATSVTAVNIPHVNPSAERQWAYISDTIVRLTTFEEVLKAKAYLCLYERV